MTPEDAVPASPLGPLCIDCLADLDALEELLAAASVESRVDTCAGCQHSTRVTYRFQRARPLAA